MSSVAVSPTVHAAFPESADLRARLESSLGEHLSSTLLLRERAAPLTVSFGIAALDQLTGGLPRSALTEIAGPSSSGRTGVMLAALAGATRRNETCALVDASDSFDPASAATAGVDLERVLWVRCNDRQRTPKSRLQPSSGFAFGGALEQVLKVTDLLLQAGGFGMVVLDLGDVPAASARRVPLTSWFRFRRAVEPTATVLLLVEQEPCAKTCASLVLRLHTEAMRASDSSGTMETVSARTIRSDGRLDITEWPVASHAALLRGMHVRAEVERSWAQRKPSRSVGARVDLQTAI
jgi:recombination protein RecA